MYGSVAREHARSDIDLLAVGEVGLADLAPALRRVEARLGREVNVTNYSTREFRKRAAANEHFVTDVLRGPKTFGKGEQDDLEAITGEPRRPAP